MENHEIFINDLGTPEMKELSDNYLLLLDGCLLQIVI